MSEMVDVFDLYPLFFFFLQTDTDIKLEIVLILKHICCLLILLFCSDALFRCTSANLRFSLVTFRGQVIIVRLSMHFCHDLSHVSSCSIIGISTVHIFNFVFIIMSKLLAREFARWSDFLFFISYPILANLMFYLYSLFLSHFDYGENDAISA